MYKIENLCRRPPSYNVNDIGVWAKVLEVMSYISVVSNLFLLSFGRGSGTLDCANAFSFIGGEHLLMAILLAVRYAISDRPSWVRIFLARLSENKRRKGILLNCALKFRQAVGKTRDL